MSQFYQSVLWRKIQEEIYHKPISEIELCGTRYRSITKIQKKWGKTLQRSMVHGVVLPSISSFDECFFEDLTRFRRDHRDTMFLQVGSTNHWRSSDERYRGQAVVRLDHDKDYLERDFLSWYALRPTVREHMPHATILLETQGTAEDHLRLCSESGRRMIHKGQRAKLTFHTAGPSDREPFWEVWYTMSYDKGFSIVPKEQFVALMQMVTETDQGWLFLAKQGTQIVSGSLCLRIDNQLIYLYGATDRTYGHIGAHYRLMIQILSRARDHHLHQFDLLGIAPPRADDHHPLAGVTRFKQSFGGKTIVYAGSYDCIIRPLLYKAFVWWRTVRTH